jgi:hypothetical protein
LKIDGEDEVPSSIAVYNESSGPAPPVATYLVKEVKLFKNSDIIAVPSASAYSAYGTKLVLSNSTYYLSEDGVLTLADSIDVGSRWSELFERTLPYLLFLGFAACLAFSLFWLKQKSKKQTNHLIT